MWIAPNQAKPFIIGIGRQTDSHPGAASVVVRASFQQLTRNQPAGVIPRTRHV